MATYKSKYAEYRIQLTGGWKEVINGVTKTVHGLCAEFEKFTFDTSKFPYVLNGSVKESEVIEMLDKHANPQGDFWKTTDNKEAKKYEKKEKPAIAIEDYRSN